MTQIVIGSYECGYDNVDVVLRDGTGGEFYLTPEPGKCARLKVGADGPWGAILKRFMHEAIEFAATRALCRYTPSIDMANDNGGYLFVMSHLQMSHVAACVAELSARALPDLCAGYKAWNKKPSKGVKA